MNERREFLRCMGAGVAGFGLVSLFRPLDSGRAWAAPEKPAQDKPLPANIIYTAAEPGVWKGKEKSHLPVAVWSKKGSTALLTLATKHGMSETHYIVRHTVVNGLGKVLGAKTFTPRDKPTYRLDIEIPKKAGGPAWDLYLLSYCNLHDLWVAETRIMG